MVIHPRDELYEPASVFRSKRFSPRFTPHNRVAGRAAGLLVPARVPLCEAVWLLGSASTAHAEPPARLACLNCGTAALCPASFRCEETQTTLRGHPCCDAHGRLRDALRREAPERGRRPAIAICPTQPFPTGLQAPGARRWPRLPVPPSLAERMPSLAGTASKEAIHSESQAPGCSAQLS